jgi:hypothetical protein
VSADTFCPYCGTNTNPAFSDHREETCEKNPEHATQSPSESEHHSDCESGQASSREPEVFHLPSLLALRNHLAEYFDADGDPTVSDEAAKKFEAAFLARLKIPGRYVLEDFIARHGLSTAAAKPIILRVLESQGGSTMPRASKPDNALNPLVADLIAEAAAEARASESSALDAEAATFIDAWLADDTKRTLDEIANSLAQLTAEHYAERRRAAAKRLNVSVKDLDGAVANRRPRTDEKAQDAMLDVPDLEPWGDPVNGAELLAETAAMFRRFVIFQHEGEPDMAALWVAGTYCPDAFNIFPRLGATAPAEECGKTTLLDVIHNLAHRSVYTTNLSTAVAFRVIELYRPTLLIDEMDTFITQLPDLVGILNSGHKKGAYVFRCEKINDKQEIFRFATYGPVAYGMIGRPTGTLFSRTLFIRLERKGPNEVTEDLDLDENPILRDELARLRRRLLRWSRDNAQAIKDVKPSVTGLANRARDNWRPLLKIASVAGKEWVERAEAAAGAPPPRRKESEQVRLLRDIRNIFYTRGVPKLPTSVLVADLALQDESPWKRYLNGRDPLESRGLAELLETFDIHSKNISLTKDEQLKLFHEERKQRVAKGYELAQFEPRFEKYLPGENSERVPVGSASSF